MKIRYDFVQLVQQPDVVICRLVTLQSCIVDNQSSLSDVVSAIDKAMKEDVVSQLVRFCPLFGTPLVSLSRFYLRLFFDFFFYRV